MTALAASRMIEAVRLDRWDEGTVVRRVDRALELGVGGFVLFGGRPAAVERLCLHIHEDSVRRCWVGADLERGAGQQFRGLETLPPSRALSVHPEAEKAAREAGAITGGQAASLGLNWVLAPVLDLDSEPRNPIVGTRSFGEEPARVARLGAAWIAGCQGEGVAACAKHFPGHGRTTLDSHLDVPVVEASADDLTADLHPFRAVVDRVDSVLTAHVVYPAYGDRLPATRSPAIVGGLLRGRLGYEGVIATDAMIMAGVGSDAAEAAVDAVRAGSDFVVYPADLAEAIERLNRAAERDSDLADAVSRSVARTDHRLRDPSRRLYQPNARGESRTEAADARGLELALDTLVDRGACLDHWRAGERTQVILVWDDPVGVPAAVDVGHAVDAGDSNVATHHFGEVLVTALREAGWRLDDPIEEPRGGSAPQRLVLAVSTPRGFKGHAGFSHGAVGRIRAALGDRGSSGADGTGAAGAALIVFGHQRLLDQLGLPGLCAWGAEPVMERAAAAWLASRVGSRAGA